MRYLTIFLIALMGLSATQCFEPIQIDSPFGDNLMVVNSFYAPDSVWCFDINALASPLDSAGHGDVIPDVTITLTANDNQYLTYPAIEKMDEAHSIAKENFEKWLKQPW